MIFMTGGNPVYKCNLFCFTAHFQHKYLYFEAFKLPLNSIFLQMILDRILIKLKSIAENIKKKNELQFFPSAEKSES